MKLNNYKLCWFYEISNEKNNHISIFKGKLYNLYAQPINVPAHHRRITTDVFTLCFSALPYCAVPPHCVCLHWATCQWPCTCCRSYPVLVHGGPASQTQEPENNYSSNELLLSKFVLLNHEYTLYAMFVPYGLTLLSRSVLRSGWAPEIRKRVYQSNWWTWCVHLMCSSFSWGCFLPDSARHVLTAALSPPLWGWCCSFAPRPQREKRQRWFSLWCRPGRPHSSPPWPEPHSDSCRGRRCRRSWSLSQWQILHHSTISHFWLATNSFQSNISCDFKGNGQLYCI